MKIGLSIPNNWGIADVGELIDIGVLAEQCGFHALWTSEHLVNVSYVRDRIGDEPYYNPLAILSALSVKTSRILLGTSILVLPFHSPFFVAKYFATLDHLSRGRAVLGVGIGNVPEEFEVVGVPWSKRGASTDEAIAVIRALWSQDAAEHNGENWQFTDVHTSPKPFGAMIPIWVGGISPAALRRTAGIGQGWHAVAVTPDQFRTMTGEIRKQAAALGRDPAAIATCMRVNIAFEGEGATESELKASINADHADDIRRVVDQFREAGATDILFALNCRRPEVVKLTIRKIADALAAYLEPGAEP